MQNNTTITLKDLFGQNKIFNIPIYQRAYAWEDKQLFDFWDDIINQKDGKNYYFGTILLKSEDDDNEDDFAPTNVEIVDGQQRLTTVVIFIKSLLEFLKKHPNSALDEYIESIESTYLRNKNTSKLNILEQDNDFFKTYIMGDSNPLNCMIKTPSQKRLLNAKTFFSEKLNAGNIETVSSLLKRIIKFALQIQVKVINLFLRKILSILLKRHLKSKMNWKTILLI